MLKSPTGVLVGHIFANAAEEKIVFLKMAVGEETLDLVLSFGREDSVRGIGAWISRGGLGKMPLALKCLCQSALCKNDSPPQGNRIFVMR